MFRQLCICPRFCWVAKFTRTLTSNINDPCFFIIRYFCISSSSRSVINGIFNATLSILFETKKNTAAVQTNFFSNRVNRLAICFQQENSCSGNCLSLQCSCFGNGFQAWVIFKWKGKRFCFSHGIRPPYFYGNSIPQKWILVYLFNWRYSRQRSCQAFFDKTRLYL